VANCAETVSLLQFDAPAAAAGVLHSEQTGAQLNSPIAAIRGLSATASVAHLAERLPQIATGILAIALAIELGFIVLGFLGSSGIGTTAVPSASSAPGTTRRPLDVQSIVSAHLFGVAAPAPGTGIDASNAPNTTMNLVLAGTIATDDPQHGLAIIGETAATAKVYSVGDAVNGGATLHAVYTDRVLLERGGAIEALNLPRQSLGGAGVSSAGFAPTPGAGTTGAALAENVRRLIARDPGALTQIMRTQPVFLNGQQRGFRVYPGTNRQQFAKLGLMPGDLVTSVNGTPLDDPARGSEIFRTIGSSDSVRVTIERNGQRQELTLNMAQIANQAQEFESGSAAGAAGSGMIPMNQVPQMPAEEQE